MAWLAPTPHTCDMHIRLYLITILSMWLLPEPVSRGQSAFPTDLNSPPSFTWQKLETNTDASFRGLCVVNDDVFWISGSKGTVIRSIDGGKTFTDLSVQNAVERDFRDVHAFNENTAVVMNAGAPGVFFRTSDGGNNWSIVHNDLREDIFFDAMDFWDDQHGVAFGDPIDGRLVVLLTEDGGRSWKELDRELQPNMMQGEAGFAASGSCIAAIGEETILIGTGGGLEGHSRPTSRLLVSHNQGRTWMDQHVPIIRNQSSGIFSLCKIRENTIIVVGGDYTQPEKTSQNCAISLTNEQLWKPITAAPPSGFRSAVAASLVNERMLVTAGTNGIDISMDQGLSWQRISDYASNAVALTPKRNAIITAGPNGSAYLGLPGF